MTMSTPLGQPPKTSASNSAVSCLAARDYTLRTNAKRLPWLDGKDSRTVDTAPKKYLASNSTPPSAFTRSSAGKLSAVKAVRFRDATRSPMSGQSSAVPATSRVPSVADSSPSPVARHRLSQARRATTAKVASPPARSPVSHHPSVPPESFPHQPEAPKGNGGGDTSDSMFRAGMTSSTSPDIVSTADLTPSQPAPRHHAFNRGTDRNLDNTIEGLEEMVQEAVSMAGETVDFRQVEVIHDIIEDAQAAVQGALDDPAKRLMTTMSPLPVSDPPESIGNLRPEILGTHEDPHRDSISHDWAYPPVAEPRISTCSSSPSSSDDEERGRSRFSTRSDLLLPPVPIRTATRDHIDYLLRPTAQDHARGRRHRRSGNESAVRHRRHRYRHNRSRSCRRHHRSCSSSEEYTSCDEVTKKPRAYDSALTVREQACHDHTLGFRHHHRRQPSARNWTTRKKRLTAAIACINTALLGIVVGIYVRQQRV